MFKKIILATVISFTLIGSQAYAAGTYSLGASQCNVSDTFIQDIKKSGFLELYKITDEKDFTHSLYFNDKTMQMMQISSDGKRICLDFVGAKNEINLADGKPSNFKNFLNLSIDLQIKELKAKN